VRVLLLQLDGKLPNLAVMRIAAHHRVLGDQVAFRRVSNLRSLPDPRQTESSDLHESFDRVYASLIFERTRPLALRVTDLYPGAIVGGTGWDRGRTSLANAGIATRELDYSLYPDWPHSIGFTQRGCRMSCEFCLVPGMEGRARPEASIGDIWRGDPHPRHLMLLDNDFGGAAGWRDNANAIIDGGFKVCFSQGINARLLNPELALILGAMRTTDDNFRARRIYTAWDNRRDEHILFRGLDWLVNRGGFRPDEIMVYILIGFWPGETVDDWEYRRRRLREFGARPFPMAYIDSRTTPAAEKMLRGFQRWVIRRDDLTMSWEEFMGADFRPEKVRRPVLLPIFDNPAGPVSN
jgi:hypothetical protein